MHSEETDRNVRLYIILYVYTSYYIIYEIGWSCSLAPREKRILPFDAHSNNNIIYAVVAEISFGANLPRDAVAQVTVSRCTSIQYTQYIARNNLG